jgi:uncharacterized protein YodC (DUF2158 family)
VNKNKVELGDEVQCKVTGFKGIVTGTQQCLTGCDRVHVQAPINKEGKFGENYNLDEASVKIITKQKVKPQSVQETVKKGGPAIRMRP